MHAVPRRKGSYELTRLAFEEGLPDCLVLWVPDQDFTLDVEDHWIRETFRDRLWIAVELLADGRQREQLAKLREEGRRLNLPLVAAVMCTCIAGRGASCRMR